MAGQVFLGGACGETRWRKAIAIPALEAAGVTYVDPQLGLGEWTSAREPAEMRAKDDAEVLLFVIGEETRGVASVAEVAYYLGSGRPLALALTDLPYGAVLDGRPLERGEVDDLNRGRLFLRTLAREHRVPVFGTVDEAVGHAIRLVKSKRDLLTIDGLRAVLADVSFRDTSFDVEEIETGYLVRLTGDETCVDTALPRRFEGRAWHVSRGATRSEVVRTALAAVLAWQEHEAREAFRYRGVSVFGPHPDVDALTESVRPQGGARTGGAPPSQGLPSPLRLTEDE